jgi:uncharacterized membrane protein|tara:strand:- start:834 stop:2057 length:1224 start_codon:yes stop_codon:yes gene_type:complete
MKSSNNLNFLDRIRRDLKVFVERGIITNIQEDSILEYYGVTKDILDKGNSYSRLIIILSTLGAALVGLGVVLLIAANWNTIPSIVKIIMSVLSVITSNIIGYWLTYKTIYKRIGSSIFFLAAFLFSGSVFLIGQMYHIRSDNFDILLWILLGVFPVAYIINSKALFRLSMAIVLFWPGWKLTTLITDDGPQFIFSFYVLFGAFIYLMGFLHSKTSNFKIFTNTLIFVGSAVILAVSYILTMDGIWNEWGTITNYLPNIIPIIFLTFTVLVIQSSKYYFNNFEFSPKLLFIESFVLLYLVLLSWFLFFTAKITDEYILFFILVVFNLIFLGLSLTITYIGITLKRYSLVNLGLFAAILFIFTKYFDLFIGMIDTGLFFAITGMLLLLGGVTFERVRRRLLDRFDLNEG